MSEEEKVTKITIKRNFRITIDLPYWDTPKYCQHDTDQTYAEKQLKAYQEFAAEINNFFKDHKEWEKVSSDVEFEEIDECSYCGGKWEIEFDEYSHTFHCVNCDLQLEDQKNV